MYAHNYCIKYNSKDMNILLYGIFMMFGSMLYAFYHSFGMYFLTHITRIYILNLYIFKEQPKIKTIYIVSTIVITF